MAYRGNFVDIIHWLNALTGLLQIPARDQDPHATTFNAAVKL